MLALKNKAQRSEELKKKERERLRKQMVRVGRVDDD